MTRYQFAPIERLARLRLDSPPCTRGIGNGNGEPDGHLDLDLAVMLGSTVGRIRSYRHRGITPRTADELANALGLHPGEVWPSWWDDALEAA